MAFIKGFRCLYNRYSIVFIVAISVILSVLAADIGGLILFGTYFVSLLFGVAVTPMFSGRENCAVFALLAATSIPVNMRLAQNAVDVSVKIDLIPDKTMVCILLGSLIYAMLFSYEQIVVGLIARLIWPDQHYYSEDNDK